MLIGCLVESDRRLLVDAKHRLLPVSLHVYQVPEVVVEWIGRHLLQGLDAVADVKPELNDVSD